MMLRVCRTEIIVVRQRPYVYPNYWQGVAESWGGRLAAGVR
jgi:hypothetical protein